MPITPKTGSFLHADSQLGVRTFMVRAHKRRLAIALRRANSALPETLDQGTIESELGAIIGEFVSRWLTPKKDRDA
jgi:hypothetical protein